MRAKIFLAVKVMLYCLVIWLIQTSLVTDLYFVDVQVNLIFASLLVFASYLGFFETIIAAVSFTMLIALLLYDSQIYWFYPLGAALASAINPHFIPDKFIICVLYTIGFTPLFELMSTSNTPFFDRTVEAVLLNLLTIIPVYMLVSLLFKRAE